MIETNSIKAWYLAARPKTLTAAAVPVLLGIALAYKDAQQIQTLPALLCLLFAWVMQIDSNLVNDYFDFKHGNDDETRLGPKRACAEGWITLGAMKWGIILTTLLGCAIGLPLVLFGGWEMVIVGICCVVFCFLYTTCLSYLGMGDILSLIDKIKDTTDLAKALEMEKKLRKDEFTLEQFLEQMQQIKKMGSLETILGLIPGMGNISQKLKDANVDEKEFDRVEAIIRSMTPKERRRPEIINGSRRQRIAAGCGMRVQDVNKLLKNFEDSKKMMKKMQGMSKFASKGGVKLPFMH